MALIWLLMILTEFLTTKNLNYVMFLAMMRFAIAKKRLMLIVWNIETDKNDIFYLIVGDINIENEFVNANFPKNSYLSVTLVEFFKILPSTLVNQIGNIKTILFFNGTDMDF